ncbi:hypothetical protein [Kaarinaea lacus]
MRTILLIMLLFFTVPCAAAYDPVQIKQFINDERALFQIKRWQGNDEAQQWSAESEIQLLTVEINRNQTKIGSPYFSPPLREEAKARCTAVAIFALGVATAEAQAAIENVLSKATQHHQRQSFELNNVRFDAIPVVKGSFVTMYCSVTPMSVSGSELSN